MTVINKNLISFLNSSPTPFHAVASMAEVFEKHGFIRLLEQDAWDLTPGKYFVTRNDSSIIAFVRGEQDPLDTGIRMVGAHTDSPCLRVKPNPEKQSNGYLSLGVEVYGGVLLNPWFDRDLSLAGRVSYLGKDGALYQRLVNFEKPVGVIPSLAIHLDREANKNRSINPQLHIPPLILQSQDNLSFKDLLAEQLEKQHADIEIRTILGYELSFFDTQGAAQVGLNGDFIASARLDNLLSCFVGMQSLLEADSKLTSMLVCNDHEEVGSASAEGAEGPFLKSVLERMIPDAETLTRTLARSLLISADNAHGVHPNYADKHDGNHGPILNQGPVIKINANHRYATSDITEAYFRNLCNRASVPCQAFVTRTDMACGSTIGPLTAKAIGIKTLDLGLPTFGMHSIRELAGSQDAAYLVKALTNFFKDDGPLGAAT